MMRAFLRGHRLNHATRGQIIVLVAAAAVALVGMLGLAIDLGYSYAQKRATQNAADAAAIAGTRVVTQWSTTNPNVKAMQDVINVAKANSMGHSTQTISCYYVDDNNRPLASCISDVPDGATGVTVKVSETHSTFFIQVIPGAPDTVSTSAVATAHAQIVQVDGSGAPFIMCGADAKLADGTGSLPIMIKNGSTYTLNENAIGKTFIVHGPQIDDCGLSSDSYKGLADQGYNQGKALGDWFNGDTGDRAGPAREQVNGALGCQPTTQDPYDCVMYVPLATDNPPPEKKGNLRLFQVVDYAAFEVSSCGSNCHQATLLSKFLVETPSNLPSWTPGTWARGDDGIIAIRLTR